jgi:hypothetical protein
MTTRPGVPPNTMRGGKAMPTLTLNSAREETGSMIDDKNMIVMSSFFIAFPLFSTGIPFKLTLSPKKMTYFQKKQTI